MLAAMAMDLLDVSIVNLALPAIRDDIGASPPRWPGSSRATRSASACSW
ncbi:hypothetical protein ACFQXA_36750 [Nocardiopsis composta]